MQTASESTNSKPIKTRPFMFAKFVYIHPESGSMVERIFDMWREDDKAAVCRLIQWATVNKVELRMRTA